jgi:negative regulator of sigma E activity
MTVQKRQLVARLMDDLSNQEELSNQDVEQLINDSETRSIWSRFHLVSDIIKGEVPEAISPDFDQRVQSAISNEPTILVPSARNKKSKVKTDKSPSFIVANIRDWAEQATGLAIAASVTAVMVLGVQTLNSPQPTQLSNSAITSLELLEVDNLQIAEEVNYTELQESLINFTKDKSNYGLQFLKPQVSVVNHSVTVPLTLIKSNFDSLLEESKKMESEQPKETAQ